METTLYLIKLFGVYFLSIALLFTIFPIKMKEAISSILKDEALIRTTGLVHLFSGWAIILAFFGAQDTASLILQVLGALMLISGFFRLIHTTRIKAMVTSLAQKKFRIFYLIALWLVGLYLVAFCC
jgi:hypothetical protein